MNIYIGINALVILSLLGLGLAVLIQNKKLEINRIFAVFGLFISIWITANYISNDIHNSTEVAVIANYFVFAFSFLSTVTILRFVILLTNDNKAARLFRLFLPAFFAVALLCFTPLVIRSVELQGSLYAVIFGPLVPVYALGLLGSVFMAGLVLRRNIKKANAAERARLSALFWAISISISLLLVTQFILPTATGWFGLTNIGILSMLIIVAGFYYSVARHRLFDLRLVVVRSLAYLLSLGVIIASYAIISLEASRYIFTDPSQQLLKNAVNVLLVIVAALTYGPAKKYFDRITNKLFYRDAYDPQDFLNNINRVVVTSTDMEKMLNESVGTIEEHLKSEYTIFNLRETAYTSGRIIGAGKHSIDQGDVERLNDLISSSHGRILIADELPQGDQLKRVLQKYDIAVLARLATTLKYDAEGIGFLILGNKKSGNPYTKQDVDIVRIIAGELAIAIENALRFEEIENFNVTLQQKVDDATKRLKKANDKLKAMDETKDEFISMASHQLRTPLTSVKGYVSMVLEGDAGPVNDMQKKLLEQSFISSQRMVFLIADLLNLSRLKTGKFVIEAVPCNLAEVIQGEVEQLKETAEGKDMKLEYSPPKDFPTLMLDETKIRQVIMNFVDNAIYYTPAGGKIEIGLEDKGKTIEFTVKDNGIGVPEAEQHHLFSKFFRAKNAQKARPDGTGLGLFMAKKVIVAQGGALIFSSTVGKGSTFGFSFAKDKLAVDEIPHPPSA